MFFDGGATERLCFFLFFVAAGEEVFEREEALGAVEPFACNGAADGGCMDADFLGYCGLGERSEGYFSLIEELDLFPHQNFTDFV